MPRRPEVLASAAVTRLRGYDASTSAEFSGLAAAR